MLDYKKILNGKLTATLILSAAVFAAGCGGGGGSSAGNGSNSTNSSGSNGNNNTITSSPKTTIVVNYDKATKQTFKDKGAKYLRWIVTNQEGRQLALGNDFQEIQFGSTPNDKTEALAKDNTQPLTNGSCYAVLDMGKDIKVGQVTVTAIYYDANAKPENKNDNIVGFSSSSSVNWETSPGTIDTPNFFSGKLSKKDEISIPDNEEIKQGMPFQISYVVRSGNYSADISGLIEPEFNVPGISNTPVQPASSGIPGQYIVVNYNTEIQVEIKISTSSEGTLKQGTITSTPTTPETATRAITLNYNNETKELLQKSRAKYIRWIVTDKEDDKQLALGDKLQPIIYSEEGCYVILPITNSQLFKKADEKITVTAMYYSDQAKDGDNKCHNCVGFGSNSDIIWQYSKDKTELKGTIANGDFTLIKKVNADDLDAAFIEIEPVVSPALVDINQPFRVICRPVSHRRDTYDSGFTFSYHCYKVNLTGLVDITFYSDKRSTEDSDFRREKVSYVKKVNNDIPGTFEATEYPSTGQVIVTLCDRRRGLTQTPWYDGDEDSVNYNCSSSRCDLWITDRLPKFKLADFSSHYDVASNEKKLTGTVLVPGKISTVIAVDGWGEGHGPIPPYDKFYIPDFVSPYDNISISYFVAGILPYEYPNGYPLNRDRESPTSPILHPTDHFNFTIINDKTGKPFAPDEVALEVDECNSYIVFKQLKEITPFTIEAVPDELVSEQLAKFGVTKIVQKATAVPVNVKVGFIDVTQDIEKALDDPDNKPGSSLLLYSLGRDSWNFLIDIPKEGITYLKMVARYVGIDGKDYGDYYADYYANHHPQAQLFTQGGTYTGTNVVIESNITEIDGHSLDLNNRDKSGIYKLTVKPGNTDSVEVKIDPKIFESASNSKAEYVGLQVKP